MNKFSLLLLYGIFSVLIVKAQTTIPEQGIKNKQTLYTLYKNAVIHSEPGKQDTLSVLIFKNEIVAVDAFANIQIPVNTVVQDWQGFHIYPAFIEFNSGYGLPSAYSASTNKNRAVYWNDAIHPEINAVDVFSPNEKDANALRQMGFGYSLSQIKNGIMRGTSLLTQTGNGSALENVLISEAANNLSFQKGKSKDEYPKSLMGSVALLRQAYYDFDWFEKSESHEINYSLEAMQNSTLTDVFEVENKDDIIRLNRVASEFDKRYVILGNGDTYQLQNTNLEWVEAIVAPLNFPAAFDMSDPDLSRFVSQSDLLHWERAPFNPFFIQQMNVPLILSGNGIKKPAEFFENLRTSIQKGLDRDSALAALTTVPARLLNMENKIGKIDIGYLANLLISKGDLFTESDSKLILARVNGEEHFFENREKHKLEAIYTLNINDIYFDLIVKGDEKFTTKVLYISEKDTTEMKAKLVLQSNEVSLQFEDKKEGGFYRLAGTVLSDNRIWNGQGYTPSGTKVNWNAIRRKAKSQPAKTDTLPATDSIPLPPSFYFPMTAYGFDSIPKAEILHIKNATIWTNDSLGVIENGEMIVAYGKIIAVGKNLNPNQFLTRKNQENYTVLDAKGKHITSGIIDEHSHIAITRGVNEGTQSSTAEVRISDALNPDDINIFRQLSGGVTTSQLLHGSANPIGGQSALIKLRWGESYENLLFKNAPPFIKFALGENVKQSNWGPGNTTRYPQTRMGVEQFFYDYFYRAKEYGQLKEIAEARRTAKKSRRKQSETSDLKPFRIDLEMEALLEILKSQRFITCHSYVQSEINMLMHVADSMDFKVNTFTHVLEGYKVADKLKAHGAAASTFSDWWAYKYEVKDAIPYNASILNKAGVVTAINSDDAEMARRLNQEAAKSIKYGGMSEEDALKMVTLNPAKMLHIDKQVGSITAGKDADFVIWSGHPLSVYSKAEKTFIDGIKYFDRALLYDLEKRDLQNRARIAALMEKEKDKGKALKTPSRTVERLFHCDSEY